MIYIPNEWIRNQENTNKIFEILNKLDNDIKDSDSYSEDDAFKDLEKLDEDIIIEKLKNGIFSFGA